MEHGQVATEADQVALVDKTKAPPGEPEGQDVDLHATNQDDGPPGQVARARVRSDSTVGATASLTEALTRAKGSQLAAVAMRERRAYTM